MKVPLIEFVALGLVCALSVRFTLMFAVKRALFDEPNERSSHRVPCLAWAARLLFRRS
jgi:hypothetical protein